MTSVVILLAVVAAVGLVALLLRRSDGRVRLASADVSRADQLDLGLDPQRWTFVEFTAPGCAPCVQARAVLDDVAGGAGADVIAVDVAEHLDAARHHGVLRAPTTLVIAPGGHVRARVTGVPHAADLRRVLAEETVAAGSRT